MRNAKSKPAPTKQEPVPVSETPDVYTPVDSIPSGLIVCGTVVFRTKRFIPSNSRVEIVTYTISDDKEHYYYVEDFSPSEYYELGQFVQLPIYIKAYIKKSGGASYSLNVFKPFQPSNTQGSAF